ncbi:MAG: hypothetical protein O7G30_03165 [Proteobacteria bacterium]|nr:hypothetical protein [Pseudomonadota bacterium]
MTGQDSMGLEGAGAKHHAQTAAMLLAGVSALLSFFGVGLYWGDSYTLDLGSLGAPASRYSFFLVNWTLFGLASAGFLTVGIARTAKHTGIIGKISEKWRSSPDGLWLVGGAIMGFAIPAAIRTFVLQGAPLTDDESAYRFMAQCLIGGRVSAPSPPMKLFFDNVFMVNDGSLYAHYFIGWPALLSPGVIFGATGYMNSLYSAVTVPAVFLSMRRFVGSSWAKASVVVFFFSPMLMVAASTEMAHTTCFGAIAWATWFCLRSRDESAPWWSHFGFALSLCIAFFIRPTTALGLGAPLLAAWGYAAWNATPTSRRSTAIASFVLPSIVMAALFLAANTVQNGSAFQTAYDAAQNYEEANGFRFAGLVPGEVLPNFDFSNPRKALENTALGLLRLNCALFGWPLGLALVFLALRVRGAGIFWAMAAGFLVTHFFVLTPGIDTFGPVYYTELGWPALALSIAGFKKLGARSEGGAERAAVLLAVLIAITSLCYIPVRFGALHKISENINLPFDALKKSGVSNAVVFYIRPWTVQRLISPTRHFVFWRPNNDPDLENDVLWVNHLSVKHDKRLMGHFPDRKGYLMLWDRGGTPRFRSLDSLGPGEAPKPVIGGTGIISF